MKTNDNHVPARDQQSWQQAQRLALSNWALEKNKQRWAQSTRAKLVVLRAKKELQNALERELDIPTENRSQVKLRENASASCLLIHDVGGSPADLKPLTDYLYQNNMNVYSVLLPGPETGGERISAEMWRSYLNNLRNIFQLLRQVSKRVHVVGHGLGAALAILLARKEAVTSLALLAPALLPRISVLERIRVWFRLHVLTWLPRRLDQKLETLACMDKSRAGISRLKIPIYAAQCEDDTEASPMSLRILQKKSRHKASRFQIFPEGGHAILAAHGENSLYRDVLRFFRG